VRVVILGSAAGGGVPQWNCACPHCRAARAGAARTQSTIAVSADDAHWVLLNASPDLRVQLAGCRRLWPTALRSSPVRAVVLTDAELDHTLGLLGLREAGDPMPVYAPPGVLALLTDEWPVLSILATYRGAAARPLVPDVAVGLTDRAGSPLGLSCTAIALARRPPRYARRGTVDTDTVGVRIEDARGAVLAYVPAAEAVDEQVRRLTRGADLVCFDGTFWSDDELGRTRSGAPTAREMGHVPLGGPTGSLETLSQLGIIRAVLVHVNNTNPILDPRSSERRAVDAAGVTVAEDGMEFEL